MKTAGDGLRFLAAALEARGASLSVEGPGIAATRIGPRPGAARVVFRTPAAVSLLRRPQILSLAEAHLAGEIDLEGDLLEVMKLTDVLAPDPKWTERIAFGVRLALRNRRRLNRESIAFHYDRRPEFFLPWLDRWRSYSHGLYAAPEEGVTAAQERKLQFALGALGVKPGQRVFDMGCGWGSFLEYAGRQGVRVHGITISRAQHAFVRELIARERLPCEVELVDLMDFRPRQRFDGAVFMGTFEHFPDYRRAARFLAAHLTQEGCLYTDFCAGRGAYQSGAFIARHIWPGTATYVNLPRLLRALEREGFGVHRLADDTASYALTVRDWAEAFDRVRGDLAPTFGEESVRAFRLYLRASQFYLERGKTQAYHLVAGRAPAALQR